MSTLTATPDTSSSDTIPATMRAAVYRGVNDVHVETVPVPEIGAGEVLIKVASAASAARTLRKSTPARTPRLASFGHETAGTIVANRFRA
jgi:L-iditol 2-dehydrogenase